LVRVLLFCPEHGETTLPFAELMPPRPVCWLRLVHLEPVGYPVVNKEEPFVGVEEEIRGFDVKVDNTAHVKCLESTSL
jgi:hypothetical protein